MDNLDKPVWNCYEKSIKMLRKHIIDAYNAHVSTPIPSTSPNIKGNMKIFTLK